MHVSATKLKLERGLSLIKTAVALCPMFGLLGTVTGMIEVFDVMAVAGSGNARGMASGVSKATLPTMAGMVAALSGMLFSIQLDRYANSETERVAEQPGTQGGLTGTCEDDDPRTAKESEVNLTPMLDVVFIMLIFFIVTASFVKEAGIDITGPRRRPPSARSAATSSSRSRRTTRSGSTGAWSIPRALRANLERLHAENPQGSVVIQADTASKNGLLVQVMDAARLAGVASVSLAAEVVE